MKMPCKQAWSIAEEGCLQKSEQEERAHNRWEWFRVWIVVTNIIIKMMITIIMIWLNADHLSTVLIIIANTHWYDIFRDNR